MAKLTPKQRVLKRWPNASITSYAGPAWVVYAGDFVNRCLNVSDRTPQQAWAQAAKHPTVRRTRAADSRVHTTKEK